MKFNFVTSLLATTLVVLITYFLSFNAAEQNKLLIMGGCFLTLTTTLIGAISITFENKRSTVLVRITSWVFFFIQLISHILFTVADQFDLPTYTLVAGGLIIIYAIITYSLSSKTT